MPTPKIIMPLPNRDFDPTEAGVAWKLMTEAGFTVHFATPFGVRAHADPLMLHGEGLDPWGRVPGLRKLRLAGLALRADAYGRRAYAAMERDPLFLQPLTYERLKANAFDGLYLPGGHAQGMRPYLENRMLQAFVADYFRAKDAAGRPKPVAAVCHGVLLAARSIAPDTGRSVLHGRKTTALTWKLENSAWTTSRYWARPWDPDYYRTYREAPGEPVGHWGVEQEIKRLLASPADFVDVPGDVPNHWRKTSGLFRDRPGDARAAWVVQDGNYLSARWPGDVHTLAQRFVAMFA